MAAMNVGRTCIRQLMKEIRSIPSRGCIQPIRIPSRPFTGTIPRASPQPNQPNLNQASTHQHSQSNNNNRYQNASRQANAEGIETVVYYSASVIVVFVGLAYAAVPLYKLICTQTGLDGTPLTSAGHKFEPESMVPVANARPIRVTFDSSTSDAMRWNFKPIVKSITIVPGETALTFFTAKNPTNEDIVGISTYSVVPPKAAQYFNKIQCFCFEEQKLAAGEEVDMPVFFYIDPEFVNDPWMKDVSSITLSYTFFKSKMQ
ncbi:hypothetical protein SmJEL517_g02016 [Synchytrium microbalum]|uniref:Cytochrome c oxidase assembly protein CtaG/Cox11 n=1 Tax=Synchytrium microbalum TaxID=1806994 RepID=A0A507CCD3_9FUNG|nr:uncharacterized protein SmJEL517_g02016 [Synchytrium microbalum]TPX35686.1 hypothetical protein SmJEL517_g02016 [Synchytrium microbalum]